MDGKIRKRKERAVIVMIPSKAKTVSMRNFAGRTVDSALAYGKDKTLMMRTFVDFGTTQYLVYRADDEKILPTYLGDLKGATECYNRL